jgi:hypothetical protein
MWADDEGELGFIANLPQAIEADGNDEYPHLAGFPLNIMFTGIRQQPDGSNRMVAACYWFDPGTYREDKAKKQMTYVSRKDSHYHMKVILKRTGVIETRKYRGKRLICQATGNTFENALIHATMSGMEWDEREDISVVLRTE